MMPHRASVAILLVLSGCCCRYPERERVMTCEAAGFESLVASLGSAATRAEQARAVHGLIAAGDAAIPALVNGAQRSTDDLQKIQIVNVLGSIGAAAAPAVSTIEAFARDSNPHLASAAVD